VTVDGAEIVDGDDLDDDHIPVPAGHAPRLDDYESDGFVGLLVQEVETGAWIQAENPWEVCR